MSKASYHQSKGHFFFIPNTNPASLRGPSHTLRLQHLIYSKETYLLKRVNRVTFTLCDYKFSVHFQNYMPHQ